MLKDFFSGSGISCYMRNFDLLYKANIRKEYDWVQIYIIFHNYGHPKDFVNTKATVIESRLGLRCLRVAML